MKIVGGNMTKVILAKNAPKPIGPYSQAILVNNFLFVSGQISINPETGVLDGDDIIAQTHRVLKNIDEILKEAAFSFSDVVKTTIYLSNIKDFPEVNSVYENYVKKPYPARTTVEVSNLPKDALIEIDVVAFKKAD